MTTAKAPRQARRKKTTPVTTPVQSVEVVAQPSAQPEDQQTLLNRYAARIGFLPSRYQADLFAWVERGDGNAVVNAVAGSGKTVSSVSAARFIAGQATATFLAFNNHIVEALTLKLAGTPMKARTIHSSGFGMIAEHLARDGRMQKPDPRKYTQIARALTLGVGRMADDLRFDLQRALTSLGSKVRVTLTDPRDTAALDALCEEYGITLRVESLRAPLYELLPELLLEGERQARDLRFVDFDDMLSLPARWNLMPSAQVEFLFVDELQDLSRAQLDTALRLLAIGGRFCGVGDQCQPVGTMVRVVDRRQTGATQPRYSEVPIEQVKEGQCVVTYSAKDAHYYTSGVVTGVTERPYDDDLVVVKTPDGRQSKYTLDHLVLTSFEAFRNSYAVYLMRRGAQFRVGMSKVNVAANRGSGPVARLLHEGGDAAWILGFYETREEAFIAEQAISGRFGLPQLVFNDVPVQTKGLIEQAWEFIGDNSERGVACLSFYGLRLEYPLLRRDRPFTQSLKRPIVTHAANLRDGCLVLSYAGQPNARKEDWQPVAVRREHYRGAVYSFTVDPYHTYIADGIVTHNCQAIMGFAGAAVDSFHQAAERTRSIHLPLSICYRCPTSHLALAREIVPQIEARQGAPEGTVASISRDKLGTTVQPGDMVICRLTAPLVEECIHLIEQGIPARVRGRDIGKQLADIVRAVAHMPRFTWAEFLVWLGAYEESQVARLAQRDDNESAMESFQDRCAAIRACYQRTTAADPDVFCREMEALFDDGQPTVLLSTIHRAKGLEAPRVFILRPDKLPLVWPKQKPWQLQQEWHLKYVALTRATQALFWVY